jgi:hypothetical protein
VRWLFEHATGAERALLTSRHARHNVGPNPPPPEAWDDPEAYERYAESAWASARINTIHQHTIPAFLGLHVREQDLGAYLHEPAHGRWLGFGKRSAVGLELELAHPT